jgi:cytochrome bd-type quinol oxidase subunit 2
MIWKIFGNVDAKNAINNMIPCSDGTCDNTNIWPTLLNWSYFILGIVCIIMVIVGGIWYVTSEGEPEKVKKAQSTITYSVVGLAIAIAAAAITYFVVTAAK